MGTPARADGDEALQRCQDALFRRLGIGRPGAGAPPRLRVFVWTRDDAHGAPDMDYLFRAGQDVSDAEGADKAFIEVTRLEPATRAGTSWCALVPCSLRVLHDSFSDAGEQERAWFLDDLTGQIQDTFWATAFDILQD